jgi:hypothetical protein
MAQEIVVKLIVQDGEVEQATKEINKLNDSVNDVNSSTKKTGETLGNTMDSAGQSANNLSDGVQGAARQVRVLGKAAKTSGKAMRSALISTGIGALVIAVGLLVENWEAIGKAIGLINPSIEQQLEVLKEIDKSTQIRVDLLDKEINLATKQGKATEQLQKQRINLVKILQQQKKEQLLLLESEAEELKTSALTLTTRQKIVKAIMNANIAGSGDLYIIKQQEEASTRYKEIQDLIVKSKIEQVDLETKLFDLQNPDGLRPAREPLRTATTDIEAEGIVNVGETPEVMLQKAINEELFALGDNLLQYEQQKSRKKIEIEQDEAERKKQIRDNALNYLIRIAGRETKVGKALLIAKQALLAKELIMEASKTITFSAQAAARSTVAVAEGTAQTAKVGFPQNIPLLIGYAAQAAGIISAIMSATKKATQIGTSFGGGGGFSPLSVETPSFNVVGTGGVTQSQFQESLQAQDTPIRAYVVSGDVTSSQEFDRNVENSSSIG